MVREKDRFETLLGNIEMIKKIIQSDVENVQSREYATGLIGASVSVIKEIEKSYSFYVHAYDTRPSIGDD